MNAHTRPLADTELPFVENTSHFLADPRLFVQRVLLRFKVVFEGASAMAGAFSLSNAQLLFRMLSK